MGSVPHPRDLANSPNRSRVPRLAFALEQNLISMPPEASRISTRSLAQAMDWSLVLISQGIGSEIQQDQANSTWGLLVMPEDYLKAVSAIRQYRLENRRWWRHDVFHPGLLFDWGSLCR